MLQKAPRRLLLPLRWMAGARVQHPPSGLSCASQGKDRGEDGAGQPQAVRPASPVPSEAGVRGRKAGPLSASGPGARWAGDVLGWRPQACSTHVFPLFLRKHLGSGWGGPLWAGGTWKRLGSSGVGSSRGRGSQAATITYTESGAAELACTLSGFSMSLALLGEAQTKRCRCDS